ncbi:metal-dependent phosphohydrolase [Bacteriovorax sp. Seq25_V]|uniref:metal-dependent phosphohydrolase n=1 Tax=Bacteriovorax sp. Seq25_V TaxID=1201288 RepID=UPI00038A5462|nr:metal-dependent phosphohydrolase [Bacteriovorax sp. Seq25_V]EQC46681.1 HD domain protein [Bacteriovorax sp. Seq25_V]
MSKILLISDNEVLNSLYSVNLKIYAGLECEVKNSLEEIVDIIESESFDYKMVISLCMIGDQDTALLVYHYLVENDRESIPLIVMGKQSEVPTEVQQLGNLFDVKSLIGEVASSLNITAQDMARREVPDFYPMPIRLFFPLRNAPCNTFYSVRSANGENEYLTIFQENEGIWPKIRSYLDEGVHVLYVEAKNRFTLAKIVTTQLIDDMNGLSERSETSEKLDKVELGIETVAEQIFDGEMTKEIVKLSTQCMETLSEVMNELPDLKGLLRDLTSNKSGFLYSHSVIAGFVATHILDNIEWGGESHKEKLKFVLFFHDMHLVSVYKKYPDLMYEENLIFDARLSEEEKEIVISHANEAADAIKRFPKCPMGVDTIIRQHHGTANGLGFATTYKDDISPLAKVLIIAEAFTEELLKNLHSGNKVDIPVIVDELCEKFPKHTYVKIAKELLNLKL